MTKRLRSCLGDDNTVLVGGGGGVTLTAPPGALYTLSLPTDIGVSGQHLTTDGVSQTSWTTPSTSDATKLPLAGGTMTGPILQANGSDAAPSYSFSAETDTGIYREADQKMGFAVSTVNKMTVGTNDVTFHTDMIVDTGGLITGPVSVRPDAGNVEVPSFSFSTDTDTGMYLNAPGTLGFACGGIDQLFVDSTVVQASTPIRSNNGAAATPTFSFTADSDTGIYRSAANSLSVSAGGVEVSAFDGTSVKPKVQTHSIDGTNASPAFSFAADTDTGIYRAAADSVSITTGSTERLRVSNTEVKTTVPVQASSGSAAAPSISFWQDPDTGMYNNILNTLLFATNGTERMRIEDFRVLFNHPAIHSAGTNLLPGCAVSQANTGLYSPGANLLAATVNGTETIRSSSTAVTTTVPLLLPDGTAAAPSYAFSSGAASTGLYRPAAGQLAVTTSGVQRCLFTDTAVTNSVPQVVPGGNVAAPGLTFSGETNTGMYLASAGNLALSTGGGIRFLVNSAGTANYGFLANLKRTAASPDFTFLFDSDTGMFSAGADQVGFSTGGVSRLNVSTTKAAWSVPVQLPSYTVAQANLLTAATIGAGAQIYVSNEVGGAVVAFSDGTNWRRVTDRAIIA